MTTRMSKIQAHVRLAQQIADSIDQKRRRVASTERRSASRDRYWNENRTDEILDAQPRTQIVLQILQQHVKTFNLDSINDISDAFFDLLVEEKIVPVRGRGGGQDRNRKDVVTWTKDTAYDWFLDVNTRPPKEVADQMAAAAGRLLDRLITKTGIRWRHAETASSILIEKNTTIVGALAKILQGLPPAEPIFQAKGISSTIDPVLAGDGPEEILPEQLVETYRNFSESVFLGEARTVVLTGPYFSGKKSLVRQFIGERLNAKQQLEAGLHRLPTLAISLADAMPWQFLERVFEFYQQANPGYDRPASPSGIVERIRWMSNRTPAFVILTDVAPIDENEIVRALGQDQVGEVLLAILEGDERSRVVLTAASDHPFGLPTRRIAGRSEAIKTIQLKEKAQDSLVRHMTRVSRLLLEKAEMPENKKESLGDRIDGNAKRKNPKSVFDLIFDDILDDEGRLLVGIIVSSVDGLEDVTLEAIIDELKQTSEAAEVRTLDRCRVLRKLDGLVLQRQISPDPRRGGKRTSKILYRIQRDCSREILDRWVGRRPELARLVFWIIAREAAAQSRSMRTKATDLETIDSLGRDIQALTTLLASIDPKELVSSKEAPAKASEWAILPPLGLRAKKPPAKLAYRYAYGVLYRDDLEGSGQRLLARHDDARMRLGALMPFFCPDKPWQTIDGWKLGPNDIDNVRGVLTPEETIEMLESTAIAAVRAQKHDLVEAAAGLATKLLQDLPTVGNIISVQRILRAQVDGNILSGRDMKHADGPAGMGAVLSCLDEMLGNFVEQSGEAPDRIVARGKLLARRAEILHLAGEVEEAAKCFGVIEEMEQKLVAHPRYRSRPAPILAGRGARSYLRLAVDLARREGWKSERTFTRYQDIGIPYARPVPLSNTWLLKARQLEALNSRRLSRGRSADWIGARIDASRLAMVQHEYVAALQHLDDALKFRFTPGSSIETLLELLAVRARALVDGAAIAMAWYDSSNPEELSFYRSEIEKLFNYLGEPIEFRKDDEPTAAGDQGRRYDTRGLSQLLNVRAREALNALKRFLEPMKSPDYPFLTFAGYLEVWLEVIESRQTNLKKTGSHLPRYLQSSRKKLQDVISTMRSTSYCMHLYEAELLLSGLPA